MLHCPTSPFSHPSPSCKARGCLGCSGRSWPCGLAELPCSPFKERLEKTPQGQHSLSQAQPVGTLLWCKPRNEERTEPMAPSGAGSPAWQMQAASPEAACQHCPLLPTLPTGQGGRDSAPACTPRLKGEAGAGGGCSIPRFWDGDPHQRSRVLGRVGAGTSHPAGVCSALVQAAESQAASEGWARGGCRIPLANPHFHTIQGRRLRPWQLPARDTSCSLSPLPCPAWFQAGAPLQLAKWPAWDPQRPVLGMDPCAGWTDACPQPCYGIIIETA